VDHPGLSADFFWSELVDYTITWSTTFDSSDDVAKQTSTVRELGVIVIMQECISEEPGPV
jgi:hypothetical protein